MVDHLACIFCGLNEPRLRICPDRPGGGPCAFERAPTEFDDGHPHESHLWVCSRCELNIEDHSSLRSCLQAPTETVEHGEDDIVDRFAGYTNDQLAAWLDYPLLAGQTHPYDEWLAAIKEIRARLRSQEAVGYIEAFAPSHFIDTWGPNPGWIIGFTQEPDDAEEWVKVRIYQADPEAERIAALKRVATAAPHSMNRTPIGPPKGDEEPSDV